MVSIILYSDKNLDLREPFKEIEFRKIVLEHGNYVTMNFHIGLRLFVSQIDYVVVYYGFIREDSYGQLRLQKVHKP